MPNTPVVTRGKVITTTDKEIIGTIDLPADFRLGAYFGTLTLSPEKLRSISFTDDRRVDKPGNAGETPVVSRTTQAIRSRALRQECPAISGTATLSTSSLPSGTGCLYNFETKKSESLELSGTKDDPLTVAPVFGQNLVSSRVQRAEAEQDRRC